MSKIKLKHTGKLNKNATQISTLHVEFIFIKLFFIPFAKKKKKHKERINISFSHFLFQSLSHKIISSFRTNETEMMSVSSFCKHSITSQPVSDYDSSKQQVLTYKS